MRPAARKRWLCATLLIASLGVVLGATLVPGSGPDTGTFQWCVLCGDFGLADAIANVVLFVPLGIALGCSAVSARKTVALALLLSTAIEIAQLWIPGRESTLADIIWNTTGAAVGVGFVCWYPARRRFRLGGLVAATAVLAVIAGAGLLLRPAFPPTIYYGQWTAQLGQFEWYRGKVLEAEIGGMQLPSWRLQDSKGVREQLSAGERLRVRAIAGPRTERLAPLFSIFDEQQREILLVGVDRDDLVLQVSTHAGDLRLDQPDLRWRGALVRLAPGDTINLELRGARSGYCLRLNSRERCGLDYTAGQAWGLVQFVPSMGAAGQAALDCLFMFLLGLPVGLTVRRNRYGYAAVAIVVAGVLALPPLLGLAPTPPLQVAALALGVVAALTP
ncbi:MAG: VanZ family protein [Gemmatimonadales bacterium]